MSQIYRERIKVLCCSGQMKNFRLIMFNDKPKLSKKRRNDTITTKKICVCFFEMFFLRKKKTIVYK